ncbi:hypothetical protein F7Q99_39255 [Streptomyces kaniharaensis]|uniref:Uncharacterized protein n=1 Tax=Streptomyces kaniharaensis TaxID=212423 RepID=A0A6N7L541_9ACTN|nr:hypothetical protein [Streptomyces kaniharaensis]MQS18069.1 hypothetical protein [Streptomyces kaniharaensis]
MPDELRRWHARPEARPQPKAPKAGLVWRALTPQRLAVLVAALFAAAAAGAAGAFMAHFDAPFWAELVVAELVAVGMLLGSFELLAGWLRRAEESALFAIQEKAAAAHWAGTCGCTSTAVMLADCDRWNEALVLAVEFEDGAR